MEVKFIEKDQNWADETTNYWFSVDGEEYAISDCNGNLSLLNNQGYPIEDCNDHDNVKDALIPAYKKHISA